ncbi:cytochrome c biogenesis protein CcsA [Bacteroidia bacterium]|nr:cytochrome c biogenesis protein CcsA [Bacteroidia bacterium]
MEEITYIGEHLFIGNLGHFFVVVSLVAALLSAIFYVKAPEGKSADRNLGRFFYLTHAIAVMGIFITLFVIIQKHYFEYAYAYEHSSNTLALRYMISCFWEGQEGSFLLWIVWNALLGVILIFTAKRWERGVVAIMALSQVVLTAMILGINFFDVYTLGSSPFELLREKMNAPIFSSPNYIKNIIDGTGLNPLLQNYWMVIHPPTLFLGFALTIVPFAFAVTSLFQREYRAWIKPALPWALAGGMILGSGIIMGGFWAYESLSFGGYWAWDPVENASLVPWLLLISGIHLMLIKKVTNSSTIASYTLVISTYILVLYATFLTRSGVLGDTSVHSFTDLGLAGQLMQFVVLFIWLPIIAVTPENKRIMFAIPVLALILLLPFYEVESFYPLLVLTLVGIAWFVLSLNKQLDNHASEDNITGREFWMFIGSLILVLSALQVTVGTSKPVFNKIFGTNMVPPADVIGYYNMYQMPIAIVIALLMAVAQFFRYKSTPDTAKLKREILTTLIVSVVLSIGGVFLWQITNPMHVLLMFAGIFALVGNIIYLIKYAKKLKLSGASIAHIGFGMMLLGVLVSSAKKQVITADFAGQMGGFDEQARRENMLLKKGVPERLGDFMVTYQGDSTSVDDIYFKVHYKSISGEEEFTLLPNTQISEQMGLMPNPDTRHYLTYDVYTHITSLPKPPSDSIAWKNVKEHVVVKGDSIVTTNGTVFFTGVEQGNGESIGLKNTTLARAMLTIKKDGNVVEAQPIFGINENTYFSLREEVAEVGLRFGFEVRPTDGGEPIAVLEIAEAPAQPKYIVMKGIVFPYINLLWLGTIFMVLGFGIATWNRLELRRGK